MRNLSNVSGTHGHQHVSDLPLALEKCEHLGG